MRVSILCHQPPVIGKELVKVSQSVGNSCSSNSGTRFGGFTAYPLAPRLCTYLLLITYLGTHGTLPGTFT